MPAGNQLALFEEGVDVAGTVQCAVMDEPIEPRQQDSHKALGAYYTDSQIAEFLVWWAVRGASDTVLDPAFGGGVFLRAACRRLREKGGDPATQVFGVEVDAAVHRRIAEKTPGGRCSPLQSAGVGLLRDQHRPDDVRGRHCRQSTLHPIPTVLG